jgi:hypothetical protein
VTRSLALLTVLLAGACSAAAPSRDESPTSRGGSAGSGPDPSTVCGESKLGPPRLRRLSRDELTRTLQDVFPGLGGTWKTSLSADPISTHGFDNDAALLVVGGQTAEELDSTGKAVGEAVKSQLAGLLPCAATNKDALCAAEFVAKYGKRLFHRALDAEETARYESLFATVLAARDFETGIAYVTRALVQSPHAVYRSEIGAVADGHYQLAPHELATELAYDFSGTAPSDALLARAEAGELSTPEALASTARELLLSEPGLHTVEKFFDAWLGYGRASSVTKSDVSEFSTLRDQMVAETRRFLGEVVITQGGGLRELLTAPSTAPSTALAQFYGFPAPSADYALVARPTGRGIGILAQGALLSALAGPNASSPTKRGLLVLERLLCRPKPSAPPTVPLLGPAQPGMLTTRQRYESVHAQGGCQVCHQNFDPIGFGFEHFDEAGRYRDRDGGLPGDGGLPVDAASFVPNATDPTQHDLDFASLEELARGLADREAAYACVTGYLSTYVHGGADACLGETERPAFSAGRAGFIDYLASLAAEPHFRMRARP